MDRAGLGVADPHRLDLPLHDLDAVVQVSGDGQELLEVVLAVADVRVERDVVDLGLEPFEHRAVPADPVRARTEVRRAGSDQPDRPVGAAHRLGGLERELGVVLRVLVAELPGPVDLVAQPPDLDAPRLVAAVLAPLLRPVGVAGLVRVLDPVAGVLDRAEPGVDAQVRLDAQLLAIAQELVRAEAVGLERAPGVIAARRTLVARPDAVLPVVARGEVAARPAEDRQAEPAGGVHDVAPVAVGIRERAPFLEDAAVDAAAEVLGEIAEDVRVHLADHAVGIELDARRRRLGGERGSPGGDGRPRGKGQQPAMSLHRFTPWRSSRRIPVCAGSPSLRERRPDDRRRRSRSSPWRRSATGS